jgi:hypothetical protein
MEFIGIPIYQDEFDFRFFDIYSINDIIIENKEIIQNKEISSEN